MSRHPRVCVALSDEEIAAFFPGSAADALLGAGARVERCPPASLDASGWPAYLRATQPEVIVSAWRTPPLPADASFVRYLCHVTGSVRHRVTAEQIQQGLLVTNWGDLAADSVAECALLLALAAMRRLQSRGTTLHSQRGWRQGLPQSGTLFGRWVALHGFGGVARG